MDFIRRKVIAINDSYIEYVSYRICIQLPNVKLSYKYADACEPNPCNSGGVCLKDNNGGYTCDCSKTGFVGRICDIGNIMCIIIP